MFHHRNLNVLPVVLLLVGCGGAEFTFGGTERAAGSGGAIQADAGAGQGTGGATSSGGVTGVTGGHSGVTGGAPGSGGEPEGSGGDPSGTGGTATGGQPAGSGGALGESGGAAPATGGTGGTEDAGTGGSGGAGCAAPYALELSAALKAALPGSIKWSKFISCESTLNCVACAACGVINSTITADCGAITLKWGPPSVLDTGDVFLTFTAEVNTPAKYGCSGAITTGCSISGSATSGTVKLHTVNSSGAPNLSWSVTGAQSVTTWSLSSTCPYFTDATAQTDLNAAVTASLPTTLAAVCR